MTSHSSAPSIVRTDRIPLSLNQEFMCAFDRGAAEGAFSDRHTVVYGWRLTGPVDTDALQGALDDVVARHETLRTTVVRHGEDRYQDIHPPMPVKLRVRDLPGDDPRPRDVRAEEFLNEVDAGAYSVDELPHLRAVLGRFDDEDAVLVLVVHHTAADSYSMQPIIRDLAAWYAERRGFDPAELPPMGQYREFSVRQQENAESEAVAAAREYWRNKLSGARILAIPTDRPKPDGIPAQYAVHRFLIDAELTGAVAKFAKETRSSAFMITLAAYKVLLHRITGIADIAVPTFTSGRYQERFQHTVGLFFNFLPLRTDLAGCATFREVVNRVRATCFEAYANDVPFAYVVSEVPDLVAPFAETDRAVIAFEVLQAPAAMDDELIGDLRYTEIRRRVLSQSLSSGIPNGALWAMDVLPGGEIAASLKYDVTMFDERTMVDLTEEYRRVLAEVVANPDADFLTGASPSIFRVEGAVQR